MVGEAVRARGASLGGPLLPSEPSSVPVLCFQAFENKCEEVCFPLGTDYRLQRCVNALPVSVESGEPLGSLAAALRGSGPAVDAASPLQETNDCGLGGRLERWSINMEGRAFLCMAVCLSACVEGA